MYGLVPTLPCGVVHALSTKALSLNYARASRLAMRKLCFSSGHKTEQDKAVTLYAEARQVMIYINAPVKQRKQMWRNSTIYGWKY